MCIFRRAVVTRSLVSRTKSALATYRTCGHRASSTWSVLVSNTEDPNFGDHFTSLHLVHLTSCPKCVSRGAEYFGSVWPLFSSLVHIKLKNKGKTKIRFRILRLLCARNLVENLLREWQEQSEKCCFARQIVADCISLWRVGWIRVHKLDSNFVCGPSGPDYRRLLRYKAQFIPRFHCSAFASRRLGSRWDSSGWNPQVALTLLQLKRQEPVPAAQEEQVAPAARGPCRGRPLPTLLPWELRVPSLRGAGRGGAGRRVRPGVRSTQPRHVESWRVGETFARADGSRLPTVQFQCACPRSYLRPLIGGRVCGEWERGNKLVV